MISITILPLLILQGFMIDAGAVPDFRNWNEVSTHHNSLTKREGCFWAQFNPQDPCNECFKNAACGGGESSGPAGSAGGWYVVLFYIVQSYLPIRR